MFDRALNAPLFVIPRSMELRLSFTIHLAAAAAAAAALQQ